jgi:drug/metabolite transporter (DMT)-like permease
MSEKPASRWSANKGIARGILHDRTLRRRVMGRFLLLLIAVFAIGLWVIDEWLREDIWRFFLWWAGCGVLAVFVVMFALYDVFAVLREEREKTHR